MFGHSRHDKDPTAKTGFEVPQQSPYLAWLELKL